MKILVLGAGGTGGYFGGRLAQAGADVTFLVRPKRAAQLAAAGLVIETVAERAVFKVNTIGAEMVEPRYDVVLLSCKAYDLDSSIAAIRGAMHHTSCVVPLLNGISHLEALDAAFGRARVMGGSCQIFATLAPDGVVKSLGDVQALLWGPRESNAAQVAVSTELATWYAKTSVTWTASDNIMQDMWEKIVFLSTFAGMTCLMRGTVGEIIATDDGKALMQRYVGSTIAIATAEGFPPRESRVERFLKVLNTVGSPVTASMLRDLEAGNEIEAAHIVGFMLNKARQHNIDDTLLTVAYSHLQTYRNRRAAGRR